MNPHRAAIKRKKQLRGKTMNKIYTLATIKQKDKYGFVYPVSKLEYTEFENGEYAYVFTPHYQTMDLLTSDVFQGIPGLDIDLRCERYVRENLVPVFIEERTPSPNREDLWDLLNECNMTYLNRLEWLTKTKRQYIGDGLYCEEGDIAKERIDVKELLDGKKQFIAALKAIITQICLGNDIYDAEKPVVNDENRAVMHSLFLNLYLVEKKHIAAAQEEGIKKAKQEGHYKGRKAMPLDEVQFDDVAHLFLSHVYTEEEACEILGISRSTFYRRMKQAHITR